MCVRVCVRARVCLIYSISRGCSSCMVVGRRKWVHKAATAVTVNLEICAGRERLELSG